MRYVTGRTRPTFRSPRRLTSRRASAPPAPSSPTSPMRSITPLPPCRCRPVSSSAMTDSLSTPSEPQAIPSGCVARGRLRVPPSKSLTHRYLNLALLARRAGVIERPLLAEAPRLFLAALARCGFSVEYLPQREEVHLRPPN